MKINLSRRRFLWRTVMELMEMTIVSIAVIFTDATMKSLVMGGVIAIAGAGLFTWTGGFQRMEREGVLTLGGPYRFVRHPWILARFLMVFGVILMARLPWLFLIAMIGLAPMYRRLTREEDQWLYSQLGPTAAEYKAFVAGFIPQFMPAKLPASGKISPGDGFSWNRALWKRPGRGWVAISGVGGAIIGMWLWSERIAQPFVWRGAATLTALVGIFWLTKDRLGRQAPR
jgi:protein-S-isoprenylcysteine O-methyltransferase Ste14